jgi:ribosomal protein S18 acetylase RimI-like enzyme
LAQNPQARLLLWREGEGEPPFACVWLEPSGPGTWYLGMLTVRPESQAQGLGRRLLAEAEAHAVAAGARRIRMTVVNLREPLIAWYERRGYARTGDTLAFPYGDPTVGAPLRPDLGLVVLEKPL